MKISLVNWHIRPQNTPLGHVPCRGLDSAYEGLRNLGHDVKRIPYSRNPIDKHIVCWGYKNKIAGRFMRQRKDCLILELGYIGNRTQNISVGWNGLNGYAEFPEYPCDNGERFRAHGGVLKPWKEGGDYILILGQVKGDASLKGYDIMPWYIQCARKAAQIYNLPVYFRPHPEAKRRGGYNEIPGIPNLEGSLAESIEGALFTIAYNSNSCLDSILSGTPCYAGNKGTMAYDLCMKSIEEIIRPEREKLVYDIAWKQWTIDELRRGVPFIKALGMKR